MQDGQKPDLAAQVPGIGCDGLERRRDGVEQDRIDHRLVMERDLGDFARDREHDVEIGHWQQIALTVSESPFARRTLALRAMPVAASNGEFVCQPGQFSVNCRAFCLHNCALLCL